MGYHKQLYGEIYEEEWLKERLYLDYEKDMIYEELKKEISKEGIYFNKKGNFVQKVGYVRGNNRKNNKRIKR